VLRENIYLDPGGGTTFKKGYSSVGLVYAYPYEFRYMEVLEGDDSVYDANQTQSIKVIP